MKLDHGIIMDEIIKSLRANDHATDYLARMEGLTFIRHDAHFHKVNQAFSKELTLHTHPSVLVDPLTPREMDVLALLSTNKTVPEIAADLYVTPNTVRSHIKRIYDKLDVHRRLGAVQKARELNLI